MEQHWEESEKILSWREMQTGVYMYHSIEHRGTNDYGRPISVVTLEKDGITKMYYAPPSLYWTLKKTGQLQTSSNMKGTKPQQKAMNILCLSFPCTRTIEEMWD